MKHDLIDLVAVKRLCWYYRKGTDCIRYIKLLIARKLPLKELRKWLIS